MRPDLPAPLSDESSLTPRTNVDYVDSRRFADIDSILEAEFGLAYALYREKYSRAINYPLHEHPLDRPVYISLEPVNRCNLRCSMCYSQHHEEPKSMLDLESVERVLDECAALEIACIQIGLGSEALLYRQLPQLLDMTKQRRFPDVWLSTNGVLLDESLCRAIVQSRVARVMISLDAVSKDIYLGVRSKDMLERVEHNVETLLAVRAALSSRLPIVRLSFCVQDVNRHEREKFVDRWKGLVDYIDFQRMVSYAPLDSISHDSARYFAGQTRQIENSYCPYPFSSLHVWANGDVTPCCTYFGHRGLVLGNIRRNTLQDLWNCKEMALLRDQLREGRVNDVCHACISSRDEDTFSAT
jgi:radical SAM protein with 4Fe4S-binding SPASM domain